MRHWGPTSGTGLGRDCGYFDNYLREGKNTLWVWPSPRMRRPATNRLQIKDIGLPLGGGGNRDCRA